MGLHARAGDRPKIIPSHSSHAQPVAQALVLAQVSLAGRIKGHGPALEKTLDRHIGLQSEAFCQRRFGVLGSAQRAYAAASTV